MAKDGGRRGRRTSRSTQLGDNVVMADFGARRRSEGQNGDRVPEVPVLRDSWFAGQLMSKISGNTDSGRLARGRDYFRSGNVLGVRTEQDVVEALVTGSQPDPFRVVLRLPQLSKEQRDRIEGEFLRDSSHIRSLLSGGTPGVEVADEVFGSSVPLTADCTCPDPAVVCKHAVAMAYYLSDTFTRDPLRILVWRGINADRVMDSLSQHNGSATANEIMRRVVPGYRDEADGDGAGAGGVGASGVGGHRREGLSLVDQDPDSTDPETFWGDTANRVTWEEFAPNPGLTQGDVPLLNRALRSVSLSTSYMLSTRHELELCYEAFMEAESIFKHFNDGRRRVSGAVARTEEDTEEEQETEDLED